MNVMLLKNTAGLTLVGLAGLSPLAVAPASASLDVAVTPTVTAQAGGFLYSYTVSDLPTSTDTVGEFALAINGNQPSMGIITPTGAFLSNITMPAGFINDYTPGNPNITFASTDPSTDLQPGSNGVFSFLSPDAPVLQPYQVLSFDTFNTSGGQILSPSPLNAPAVPEPSAPALICLGFFVMVLSMRYAKSTRA